MSIKWKALHKRIPISVQVSSRRSFEIVWVEGFPDTLVLGETRFNPDQIAIKTNEPIRETVKTYLHELLHAIDDEYGVGLTEAQVIKLEASLTAVLKPFNIFKE